jgi:hypothetical protein
MNLLDLVFPVVTVVVFAAVAVVARRAAASHTSSDPLGRRK